MWGQQLIIQAKIIFAVIPIPKTKALLIAGTGSGVGKTAVAPEVSKNRVSGAKLPKS